MLYLQHSPFKVIIEAQGHAPKNSVALPQSLASEDAKWLEVVDGKVVVNKSLKTATLLQREAKAQSILLTKEKQSLQEFLNNTDWMIIRQTETGAKVAKEVLEQRHSARKRIDEIRDLLK